ncbi:MAG: DsrE family protein [Candidatus Hydrogenedentes bacterium]|nr:DsrE family protein [Candidatus Hydrogenedentota bacterium]
MNRTASVLLAGTEGLESMGRMANALTAVKDFKDAGDDVKLIFDGAGVIWIRELAKPEHRYHGLYAELRSHIAGVYEYCAKAFHVTDAIDAQGLPYAIEHQGHPSFRRLLLDGYQVLNF